VIKGNDFEVRAMGLIIKRIAKKERGTTDIANTPMLKILRPFVIMSCTNKKEKYAQMVMESEMKIDFSRFINK